jgi:predicted nucleotidyltransferase
MVIAGQPRIPLNREALLRFCERWSIVRLEFFGSVLRDDFGPDSDVDVLVTFEKPLESTWESMFAAGEELERLLGRRVDMMTRRAIEASENPYLRPHILGSAQDVVVR